MGYENTLRYITQKHNISPHHIGEINQIALKRYLLSQKKIIRASTVKLIHGWKPTYASLCRQGRMHSPMCAQCHEHIETAAHIIICDQPLAITARHNMLDDMLHQLEKRGTPNIMLQTFDYKLSLTLNLLYDKVTSRWTHDFVSIPYALLSAIKHQNLVGWDNFMKGFISTKWKDVLTQLSRESLPHSSTEWDTHLTGAAINLYRGIWEDRNKRLHGENRKDHLVY